jgi:hypothetical protein
MLAHANPSVSAANIAARIYRSFSSNFLIRFHSSLITWSHGRSDSSACWATEVQMFSRFIQDESRTAFVEYALIAMLVAVVVVLRVTMQA